MCEPTCVRNQLLYLRDDLCELSGNKLQGMAVDSLRRRIDGIIRQLDHFGEGQKWADPLTLPRHGQEVV